MSFVPVAAPNLNVAPAMDTELRMHEEKDLRRFNGVEITCERVAVQSRETTVEDEFTLGMRDVDWAVEMTYAVVIRRAFTSLAEELRCRADLAGNGVIRDT